MQNPASACPHCGAQISANAQFCKSCGKPITAEPTSAPRTVIPSAERKCPNCGATLSATAMFCKACGKPAKSSAVLPAAPAVAPALARSSRSVWLITGCVVAVVLIACIAAIAAGGFFFFQNTPQARATPTLLAILIPSTLTLAPNTVVVPPTLAAPAITPTTAPSPTPSPTPKCPPTPALPAGVLFSEDFGSRQVSECNGWQFPNSDNADALWSPNAYTISIKKPNSGAMTGMEGLSRQYADFALETEAQPLDDNVSVYGLIFRYSKNQDGKEAYYRFALFPDGRYSLNKLAAGDWTRVVDYTASPLIKTGKNKNTLGVIAQGSTFSLYVNRTLVKTVTDDAIKGSGIVGITVGNATNVPAAASFSRVTVLTPDKAKAEWSGAPSSTQPGQPSGAPTFSAVTFSSAFDDKTWTPINPGKVFPYGTQTIFAFWTYSGISSNANYEYEWLFNNARVDSDTDRLVESSGKSAQWLVNPKSDQIPLDRGNYQFFVRVGGQVVISDTFVIQ